MKHLIRDFISDEKRDYRFKLGQLMASALTGFVVGVIVSTMIWMVAIYYIREILLTDVAPADSVSREYSDAINNSGTSTSNNGGAVSSSAKIRVISPNGGEVWVRGKQYNVKWDTTSIPSNVSVFPNIIKTSSVISDPYAVKPSKLVGFEMFSSSIYPQGLPNEGTYTYQVPTSLAPGTYQILVWAGDSCGVSNLQKKCVFDLSDNLITVK